MKDKSLYTFSSITIHNTISISLAYTNHASLICLVLMNTTCRRDILRNLPVPPIRSTVRFRGFVKDCSHLLSDRRYHQSQQLRSCKPGTERYHLFPRIDATWAQNVVFIANWTPSRHYWRRTTRLTTERYTRAAAYFEASQETDIQEIRERQTIFISQYGGNQIQDLKPSPSN